MSASKRDELIDKALAVFYRDGFHATGMDKLVAETGISKTSMYKHFRTKEALILAALQIRSEKFCSWLSRRTEELAETPRDRLLALFEALDELLQQKDFRSCVFIKAASEYPDFGHPIHDISAAHKRLLLGYVRSLAEQAGAPEPDRLARQLLMLTEGAIVTAHFQGPVGVAADAGAAARCLIDAQFG